MFIVIVGQECLINKRFGNNWKLLSGFQAFVLDIYIFAVNFQALDGGSKTSASVQQTHRRVYYQTSRAPVSKAPLSQAVRVNDTLYISGQVGVELETGELARGVKEQTELIFIYLGEILATAGAEMDNIVRTTVYMKNIQDLRNSHEDVINI